MGEGPRLAWSCVEAATVNVEKDGKLRRGGDSLLDAGMDKGAGSGRRRVEASAKLKCELSDSSRMSAKIVEIVELLVGVSGKVSTTASGTIELKRLVAVQGQ